MLQKLFDFYEHGEKGHSTECLFGHFHKREKQAQLYFQFLQSGDFSVTKFTLQFLWILQFLKIVKSIWGKVYFGHDYLIKSRENLKICKISNFDATQLCPEKNTKANILLQIHFVTSKLPRTIH